MEIHAKVYAMARSRELLEQAGRVLDGKAYRNPNSIEVMEPCAVLPPD